MRATEWGREEVWLAANKRDEEKVLQVNDCDWKLLTDEPVQPESLGEDEDEDHADEKLLLLTDCADSGVPVTRRRRRGEERRGHKRREKKRREDG